MSDNAKGLYRFFWDCGRMGTVEGVFVATAGAVKASIGKRAYLGEVLGKHSDIHGTLDEADVTLISTDATAVEVVEKYGLATGFNPLHYIEEGG